MQAIQELEQSFRKAKLPQVQSGDTVRVHQLIREGNKQRVQIFEGVIIRTHRLGELAAVITVRRIASGVGVEKTFLLHSPNVTKVEVVRRSKVRRNFLSYLRARRGKSARLIEVAFDRTAANVSEDKPKANPATAEIEQLAADQAADDADAAVTEIGESETVRPEDTEHLDTEAKEEAKAAAADDPANDPDAEDDEKLAEVVEAESGEARAEDEDSRAQRPVQ
jgi:large subunit ribosomal protein L19